MEFFAIQVSDCHSVYQLRQIIFFHSHFGCVFRTIDIIYSTLTNEFLHLNSFNNNFNICTTSMRSWWNTECLETLLLGIVHENVWLFVAQYYCWESENCSWICNSITHNVFNLCSPKDAAELAAKRLNIYENIDHTYSKPRKYFSLHYHTLGLSTLLNPRIVIYVARILWSCFCLPEGNKLMRSVLAWGFVKYLSEINIK